MKIHPTMLVCSFIALGAQVLFCSGCASGYTRGPEPGAATAFKASSENPISEVTVELTPKVQEQLKDSLKFDQQALLRTVELALSNRQLLSQEKKNGVFVLQIMVTHVRARNTFNAVMWGAMSGNDSIKGDITVRNATGGIIDRYHVDTSYALGGFAGGQDAARMNWLYEAFAKQVVHALTGEEKKD
jgi:hypothetical protein